MSLKEYAEIIGISYNKAVFIARTGNLKGVIAVKNEKKYTYFVDPLESQRYIKQLKKLKK